MRLRFFSLASPEVSPTAQQDAGSEPVAPQTPVSKNPGAVSAPSAAEHEHRLALLIGNSRYRHDALINPINDVRLLDWALKGIGFKVTTLENASLSAMQTAIIAYAEALDMAGPATVAVIYYAGHGLQHEGRNYLLPIDADLPSSRYLSARAISLDNVFEELSRTTRAANVVVIDACRINPFLDGDAEPERVIEGLTRSPLPRPTQIVYSTSASKGAEDGARDNSPFAEALVEEIPGLLTPGRRIQDAFDDAAARVTLVTQGRQAPAMYREGILPPLTLTPEDERRLQDWSKRPRRWTRRQWLAGLLAGGAISAILTAAITWWTAYPETRMAWLLQAGLIDRAAYDFTCAPPWDGPKDRYGLTRRDWCLKVDLGARRILTGGPRDWDSEIAPALAQGDPKAVVLAAMLALAKAAERGFSNEAALKQATALADRAAATAVPAGKVLPLLARYAAAGPTTTFAKLNLNFGEVAAQIRAAASDGLLLARILTLQMEGSQNALPDEIERRTRDIETILTDADRDDATGEIAYYGHQIFSGRAAFSSAYRDKRRDDFWLSKAVAKNWPAAAEDYLHLDLRGSMALKTAVRDRLIDAVASAGGPARDFWIAKRLMEQSATSAQAEITTRLQQAAKAGYLVATEALADHFLSPKAGAAINVKAALDLLGEASNRGSNYARVRLALLLIDGLVDANGTVLVAPSPKEGRNLLAVADANGDIRATGYLADALRFGPLELRDEESARQLYIKVATNLPLPNLSNHARQQIDDIDRAYLLRDGSAGADDPAIGPKNAPVTVDIFVAPSCLLCETLLRDDLRTITAKFLNAGGVRFTSRIVAASDQPNDLAAATLLQCVPANARFTALTALIERQTDWSAVIDPTVRNAVWNQLLGATKLTKPSVNACLADPDNQKVIARRQDLVEKLMAPAIERKPFAFVNGSLVENLSGDRLERAIRRSLPSQFSGRHRP